MNIKNKKPKYLGVWRISGTETRGFPKLMVDDRVQSGSINIRGTRLPLWAIIHTVINQGWDKVEGDKFATSRLREEVIFNHGFDNRMDPLKTNRFKLSDEVIEAKRGY